MRVSCGIRESLAIKFQERIHCGNYVVHEYSWKPLKSGFSYMTLCPCERVHDRQRRKRGEICTVKGRMYVFLKQKVLVKFWSQLCLEDFRLCGWGQVSEHRHCLLLLVEQLNKLDNCMDVVSCNYRLWFHVQEEHIGPDWMPKVSNKSLKCKSDFKRWQLKL